MGAHDKCKRCGFEQYYMDDASKIRWNYCPKCSEPMEGRPGAVEWENRALAAEARVRELEEDGMEQAIHLSAMASSLAQRPATLLPERLREEKSKVYEEVIQRLKTFNPYRKDETDG